MKLTKQQMHEALQKAFDSDDVRESDVLWDTYNIENIGSADTINALLAERNQELLTEHQLECLWRIWIFQVEVQEGVYEFMLWDRGNGYYFYEREFNYATIVNNIAVANTQLII